MLMSKKHKKIYRVLNYFDHSLIVTSTINGFITISAFVSLVGVSITIVASAIKIEECLITSGIRKYKSIIKKKKKKHHKIVLLAKPKLNSIDVLLSKALIDSNISRDEFVLINNVLKEFCDMKNKKF